uniref:Uncharacterized protein n=1 Tax=viral metagenome TaxID=1070528 RepID=A0A6C0BN38_9ZZZZ
MKFKWHKRKSMAEKLAGRQAAEKRRRWKEPTRAEVRALGPKKFNLSAHATQRIRQLVRSDTKYGQIDYRDHRRLKPQDRVPRSLELPATPPGFWDIEDPRPPTVKSSEDSGNLTFNIPQ